MNELLSIVSFLMFITFVMFIAGVWHNKKVNRYKKLMTDNIIRTTSSIVSFKRDKWGDLRGVYNNKKISIKFYLFDRYGILQDSRMIMDIETYFYDVSKQTLTPKLYFTLKQKELFLDLRKKSDINFNDFENNFSVRNKNDLILSDKIKQNLAFLLKNKCFNAYAKLKVQAPSKSYLRNRGKVVFEKLDSKVVKDIDSLKIAMDIVVDVAKQMDEMKVGK